MDKSVIDRIAELVVGAQSLPETDIPVIALPPTMTLQSLEPYERHPLRYRVRYTTRSLPGWLRYCVDQLGADRTDIRPINNDQTQVFIDPDKPAARAIFDLGTPYDIGWAEHTAELHPREQSEYTLLRASANMALSQRALIDLLEDLGPAVEVLDDAGRQRPLLSVIAAVRNLKTASAGTRTVTVGDLGGSRSALESVEVSAHGEDALPTEFTVSTCCYEGLPLRRIDCRLRAVIEEGKTSLSYRIIGADRLVEDISQDFRATILAGLPTGVPVYVGTIATPGR